MRKVCPSGTLSTQGKKAVVDNENISSVIALGYPDEQCRKAADSKNASSCILIGNMKNHTCGAFLDSGPHRSRKIEDL